MLNYIDLFAGAGGLSEGFTSQGFHPVAHVEMNKNACLTLKTRACYYHLKQEGKESIYKDYLLGNITRDKLYASVPKDVLDTVINETMSSETMPLLFNKISSLMKQQSIDSIDLVVGGPPCQAYSLVGRAVVGESIVKDPRNYLYRLYLDVLRKYEPKMFVFENVPGLLSANKGRYFEAIKAAFNCAGYDIGYQILNAKNFGVLQSRRRVILVGWKKGSNFHYPNFSEIPSEYNVSAILDDLPSIQAGESNNSYEDSKINEYLLKTGIRKVDDVLTWHQARPNRAQDREIYKKVIAAWDSDKRRLKYTDLPEALRSHKNTSAFLDRFKVVASDIPTCHTMMAHISRDGHYFIHPDIKQARSLTVREAARVQSFPDDFFFEGPRTAAFMQIGNAVPPLMAKGIADRIKEEFENE